jgi:hypothetical protein
MDLKEGAIPGILFDGFDSFGVGIIHLGHKPDEIVVEIGYG